MKGSGSDRLPRAGFTDDGRRYVLRDVHLMDTAHTYLFNDTMVVDVEHRGRCGTLIQQPDRVQFAYKQACVYVRDEKSGDFWSAPHDPVQAEPDEFEFSVGRGDVRWRVVRDGIEVSIRLVVPRDDMVELWTVTVRNVARRGRHVSIYTFHPLEYGASMHVMGRFDAGLNGVLASHFPPCGDGADYYRLGEQRNYLFCAADRKPTAYEADLDGFIGPDGAGNPRQLQDKRLGRGEAMNLSAAGIFQYVRRLAPGGSSTVNLVCGPAQDLAEAKRLKRKYLAPGGMARAIKRVDAFLESRTPSVRIETPDVDFNHFVNHWLPQETLFCGRTLRGSLEPCARNAVQDAMGITYNDPASARHWYQIVLAQQDRNGWLPHGIPLRKGVASSEINQIPHRDMNVWAPPALYFYLAETGDMSILDEKIRFRDDSTMASAYDHVCVGLEWLLKDRTKRKLSRIGEGDWNDPLNMAGPKGKGESVWLTEALVYSLEVWADVAERIGDTRRATRYRKQADVSRRAINRLAWDGAWYVRGSTDVGKWFGTRRDKQGKLFLNAQSWAMMCGAAKGDRLRACIGSVEKHLSTPAGPMTLWPPYTEMRDDIGKLTLKTPGFGENGSCYVHAGAFYAFGLFMVDEGDLGWQVMRSQLPGWSNPLDRASQLPLYLPNSFYGLAAGRTAGESSRWASTGACAWYYRTAVSMLLGVRGEFDGLRLDPQVPKGWKRAKVWRRFREADFEISIVRKRGVESTTVLLDGRRLEGTLVPLQKKGTQHEVTVTVPA